METELCNAIIEFLTPLPCMQSPDSRRAALYDAGLVEVRHQTDLHGAPHDAAATIVENLERYGAVEQHSSLDNEPALVIFLRYVATTVGIDRRTVVQDWCEQLLQDPGPLSPKTQEPGTAAAVPGESRGGSRIGAVAGDAHVSQVSGDMHGNITGRDNYTIQNLTVQTAPLRLQHSVICRRWTRILWTARNIWRICCGNCGPAV